MARKLRKEGRHFHAFMTTAWFFMSRSMDKSCLPLFKMTRSILAERDEAAQFDSRTVSRRAQTCFCLDSDNLALFEDFVDPLDLRCDLPGVARAYVCLHDKRDSRRALGDDVDASLDHRHDLVPFAFEGGEHGRGFVRQTRLADGLDRGRDRLGHGAVGPIGRHRRNGECKQHRARLAPASTEAQARTAGVADGWPSRARKRRRARPELLTVGPRERGSARAAERLRIVKPGQPPRVWRRVCIGALGVDAPRRAAGVLFKLFATGVAPQTASVLDQRPSAIGVAPQTASVLDQRPSAIGIRQRSASCRPASIEQKIDNSFF